MQKSHPFGIAEKRFNWVEIYCNGNDLTNHKKLFNRKKDNLEGGIGYYFSRIKLEGYRHMPSDASRMASNASEGFHDKS